MLFFIYYYLGSCSVVYFIKNLLNLQQFFNVTRTIDLEIAKLKKNTVLIPFIYTLYSFILFYHFPTTKRVSFCIFINNFHDQNLL